MSNPSPARTRLAAAGLLGAVAALTAITGFGPTPSLFQLTGSTEDVSANCDEAEHVNDPSCVDTLTARGSDDDTSTTNPTVDDGSSTTGPTAGPVADDVRTFQAGEAGSVLVAIEGTGLQLLTAAPNQGWRVEVEQATGHEVEVTFRSGTRRVDLNLELEDGQVRERLRTRDDATDTRTEAINSVVTDDDNSGPGSGDDDLDDDNSGHGSDDDSDDVDDDNSGHGSDDDDDSDDGDGSVDD
jgi:hypothetical protein